MDITQHQHKIFKIQKQIKNEKLFFCFNSAKITSKNWTKIEQIFKQIKFKYYKVFNNSTSQMFKNSIFKHFNHIICGIVLTIKPNFKSTIIEFNVFKKLTTLFALLSLKLNNKFYSLTQFKNIKTFVYKQNLFYLHKFLNKYLKTVCILKIN